MRALLFAGALLVAIAAAQNPPWSTGTLSKDTAVVPCMRPTKFLYLVVPDCKVGAVANGTSGTTYSVAAVKTDSPFLQKGAGEVAACGPATTERPSFAVAEHSGCVYAFSAPAHYANETSFSCLANDSLQIRWSISIAQLITNPAVPPATDPRDTFHLSAVQEADADRAYVALNYMTVRSAYGGWGIGWFAFDPTPAAAQPQPSKWRMGCRSPWLCGQFHGSDFAAHINPEYPATPGAPRYVVVGVGSESCDCCTAAYDGCDGPNTTAPPRQIWNLKWKPYQNFCGSGSLHGVAADGCIFASVGNPYVANLTCLEIGSGRLRWQYHTPTYGIPHVYPTFNAKKERRFIAFFTPYSFVDNQPDTVVAVFKPPLPNASSTWNPPAWISKVPTNYETAPARPVGGCPATDGVHVFSMTDPVNKHQPGVNATHVTVVAHNMETGKPVALMATVPTVGPRAPPFTSNGAKAKGVYYAGNNLVMATRDDEGTKLVGFEPWWGR